MKKKMNITILSCFLILLTSTIIRASELPTETVNSPNIVIIQMDDIGFDDFSINGNTISQTPNIDRLAESSIQFDNFYVPNVCSPTRASLLTGRDFWRTGVTGMHGGNDYLHKDEVTFAEVLQQNGYATGMWGKWHSGKSEGYWPWQRGFDEAFYAKLYHHYPSNGYLNGEKVSYDDKWSDAQIVDMAIDFMEAKSDQPFLAYVSSLSVHGDWEAPEEYIAKYRNQVETEDFATLLAMQEYADEQIGRLLDYIDNSDFSENTIVFFMSDNGPIRKGESDAEWDLRNNHQFIGSKSKNWKNGIKSPLYVKYKGKYTPQHIEKMCSINDIFPTVLELTNTENPIENPAIDGRSFKLALDGKEEELESHPIILAQWYPVREEENQFAPYKENEKDEYLFEDQKLALIRDDYKLMLNPSTEDNAPIAIDNVVLIDCKNDLLERENIASEHPELVSEMMQDLELWFEGIISAPHSFIRKEVYIGASETMDEVPSYLVYDGTGIINNSHSLDLEADQDVKLIYKLNVKSSGKYLLQLNTKSGINQTVAFDVKVGNNNYQLTLSSNQNNGSTSIVLPQDESLLLEISSPAKLEEMLTLNSLTFTFEESSEPINTTYEPIDENASNETKYLYQNLLEYRNQRVIFGHHFTEMLGASDASWSDDGSSEKSDVKTLVGDFPGVYGYDLGGNFRKYDDFITAAHLAYQRGGIITVSWHAMNMATEGTTYDLTGNPVQEILNRGTAYNTYISHLDSVASIFKIIDAPIIFRPLHENNGGWFWWGADTCTPEEYVELWKLTVDYLKETKGIHHLLYAYSPSKGEFDNRYPGDDYVDIIGTDMYGKTADYPDNFLEAVKRTVNFANTHYKIPALTEFGYSEGIFNSDNTKWYTENIINNLMQDEVASQITYALTWANRSETSYWVPINNDKYTDDFINFYNSPLTVFNEDLVDIYKNPNKMENRYEAELDINIPTEVDDEASEGLFSLLQTDDLLEWNSIVMPKEATFHANISYMNTSEENQYLSIFSNQNFMETVTLSPTNIWTEVPISIQLKKTENIVNLLAESDNIKIDYIEIGEEVKTDNDVTSTAPNIKQEIKLYPNPFENRISVRGLRSTYVEFTLLDNHGKIVYQKDCTLQQQEITLFIPSTLPSGIYFYKVTDQDVIHYGKAIKK
ncbi:sulfatase-like hydrolase/transferase [Flammeovirga agarivorans]|uniref:Sulfatase-like hydrolase/transferase n=1 Tax=Flammeovirga agarivorans TaxID=2726742 RepID=A0A7X8SKB4_9BACT|nr:sulfatase-like hydrolase/transferase [Flammeovirga agarivorans]NLR91703.1 sulfatase-like hydrolase/transferase [Flammeovirga agarivorans]